MRIPFDNKSHKLARRRAIRAKESDRLAILRADQDGATPRKMTRRARRALAFAACLALLVFTTHAPAHARGAGASHAYGAHHASHHTASGHASASASLRAYYGAK